MSGTSRWSHKTQNRRKKKLSVNGKKKKKTTKLSCQQKGGLHDYDNGTFLTKHKARSRQPNQTDFWEGEGKNGKREQGRGKREEEGNRTMLLLLLLLIHVALDF